ncbi:MAG: hypothetical protein IAE77_06110, partial [Prosthecobacter sp.]|uniref:WD40 domain-containing protein n=1 Tax=Prosthecobacter sp. TaxID=1965333 RepID=UPI001A0610D2
MIRRLLPLLLATSLAAEEKRVPTAQAMGLLKTQCMGCHNAERKKGDLSLETRESALEAIQSGKIISSLTATGDEHMPPKKQLPEKQINLLKAWVQGGAAWDVAALKKFGELTPADKLAALPPGHAPATTLALSADGKWLAAGSGNRVVVRDAKTKDLPVIATLEGHKDVIQSLAWNGDGTRLAAGGYRSVLVWNSADWKLANTLAAPLEGRVTGLTFLADKTTLILADGPTGVKGVLHRWKLGEPKPAQTVEAHADNILSLTLSKDGKQIATGGADNLAKVWDAATLKEIAKIEGHVGHITSLAFNHDGKWLATGSADKELKVWDIATKEMLMLLGDKSAPVNALMWSADSSALTYLTDSGNVFNITELKSHDGVRLAFTSGKSKKLTTLEGVPYAAVESGTGLQPVQSQPGQVKNLSHSLIFAALDSGKVVQLDEKANVTKLESGTGLQPVQSQ